MSELKKFSTWAIVEVMHNGNHDGFLFYDNVLRIRSYAGLLSEAVIAGHHFIRIDVPGDDDELSGTRWFNPSSVLEINPISEQRARKWVEDKRPKMLVPQPRNQEYYRE